MLKAFVVDDEAPARDELRYLLSKEQSVSVLCEADSGPAAIAMMAKVKADVIFLDVEMRGLNGLQTAGVLRSIVPEALIVFATAYDEYAVKAFEVGAVDYVLKPFESERIHAAIERIRSYLPHEWRAAARRVDDVIGKGRFVTKLAVERDGKIVLVHYEDIIYVHTGNGNVSVVTAHGEYRYSGTLAELEKRLRGTQLVRVHKSYMVNLNKVAEIIPWFKGTYWLKMEKCPGVEVPVSKNQIKELKDLLGLK